MLTCALPNFDSDDLVSFRTPAKSWTLFPVCVIAALLLLCSLVFKLHTLHMLSKETSYANQNGQKDAFEYWGGIVGWKWFRFHHCPATVWSLIDQQLTASQFSYWFFDHVILLGLSCWQNGRQGLVVVLKTLWLRFICSLSIITCSSPHPQIEP